MRPVPRRHLCVSLASAALLAAGCIDTGKDNEAPGEPLGTYQVAVQQTSSTCGTEAFGTPESFNFEVKLSRDGTRLFWNNGSSVVEGNVGADGTSFSFSSTTSVKVSEAAKGKPGCTIRRTDSASGTLQSSGSAVTGFEGKLGYAYAETQGSECAEQLASVNVIALPCALAYSMKGAKR